MQENGGRWVETTWPDQVTASTVEGVLDSRPVTARNWETWETVSFLLAENVMHGVGEKLTQQLESRLDAKQGVQLDPAIEQLQRNLAAIRAGEDPEA
jgi:hypothetical protein